MSALQLFVLDASRLGVSFRIMTPCGTHSAAISLVIRFHLGGILVNWTTDYDAERNRKNRFEFLVSGLAFGFQSRSRGFEFGVLDLARVLSFGRRGRWVAIPPPGSAHVAAGFLNPPTLGRRRVGAFTRAGIACTVEKKLYGGRGLGLVSGPNVAGEVFQIGGFTVGK